MSAIATMDEFMALDVGTTVNVGVDQFSTRRWTKTDGGNWRHDEFLLHPSHFRGEVERSAVFIGTRYEVGQLWDGGEFDCLYLLLRDNDDGTFSALQMRPTTPERLGPMRIRQMLPIRVDRMMWTAVTNPPEWMQVVLRVGGMVMEARSDAEQYRTSYVRAQEEMIRLQAGHNSALVTYKGELQQALHEWADANDMSSNGSFADVLQEQGLEPPQARVEVDVTAFCSGRASVPAEAATDLLPEGAELDGSVEATFPFYVELKAEVTVAAGNCGCSQVNDSMVRDLLATKGVEYEDLNDFEVCCTND